jgi:cytochrome c553
MGRALQSFRFEPHNLPQVMKTLRSRLAILGMASLSSIALLTCAPAWSQTVNPASAVPAQTKVAMCIGCHGIQGYQASFPEVHKVPMISGQSAKYIVAALTAYQKGDRKHPTMKAVAAPLSAQDIADVAAYYEASGANLPPKPAKGGAPSPEVEALLKKGNCIACHGVGLNKPIDPSYPKLAGQHGDYIYVALKAYQTTNNPQIGRSNPIMGGQSKLFTLAELKVLASYVEGLGGDLKTVPQAKFK